MLSALIIHCEGNQINGLVVCRGAGSSQPGEEAVASADSELGPDQQDSSRPRRLEEGFVARRRGSNGGAAEGEDGVAVSAAGGGGLLVLGERQRGLLGGRRRGMVGGGRRSGEQRSGRRTAGTGGWIFSPVRWRSSQGARRSSGLCSVAARGAQVGPRRSG